MLPVTDTNIAPTPEMVVVAPKVAVTSARVPVRVEVAATLTSPVVLASRAVSAVAETVASVTAIDRALVVSVIPARVAISPSETVAVIVPVVYPPSVFI